MGCCESIESEPEYPTPSDRPITRLDREPRLSHRHNNYNYYNYTQPETRGYNRRDLESPTPSDRPIIRLEREPRLSHGHNNYNYNQPDTRGYNRRDTSSNNTSAHNRRDTSANNRRDTRRNTSNDRQVANRQQSRDTKKDETGNGGDGVNLSNIHERLAEAERIDTKTAMNIVKLFENENTIPFICRYRQDLINRNITPNKMRHIKTSWTNIVELRKRSHNIIIELEKVKDLNEDVRTQIMKAKTMKELEYLHALHRPVESVSPNIHTNTYAYRLILGQAPMIQLNHLVDEGNPNLNTIEKVKESLSINVSGIFNKHSGIVETLRQLQKVHRLVLKCEKIKTDIECSASNDSPATNEKERFKQSKYETYFNFENDIRHVKGHQILAINRGEKAKFLNVQVVLPDSFKIAIREYVHSQFMRNGTIYKLRNEVFGMAFEKSYNESFAPFVAKQVRESLTEMGKNDAIECFAKNLKQLLLKPPLKGEIILGIDPGFKNGCKLAMVSETMEVLEVGTVYPHREKGDSDKCGVKLANMIKKHNCKTIALGDGTACRETESWLNQLFDKNILNRKNVSYDIVSEQGSSVYSCSALAKKEFPKLDAKLISAVSIARRMIDPLSEYCKVEPCHLGVGMYQFDINTKFLTKSLNEVVSECVSFVGVDINTASISLLRYVSGLNHKHAENIIRHRQQNGPFRTRNDLLKVKSVGQTIFVQCAGFIRIEPKSVGGKLDNLLDCTWVHPESYGTATKIIQQCRLDLKDIGKPEFISEIKSFAHSYPMDTLAEHFGIPNARLLVVLKALQRELLQDYRPDFDKKVFIQDITKLDDLFIGQIVTGEVKNIVAYGAFVNIGVGIDGLIHKRHMNGGKLSLGDRVSTTVIEMDVFRKRIALRLDEVITAFS